MPLNPAGFIDRSRAMSKSCRKRASEVIMKEHSHCNEIARMLHSRPYVLLKDLRTWCNHRSRISELRYRFELEGLAIVPCIVEENGMKLHAYKTEPIKRQEPVVVRAAAQGELFGLTK